LGYQWQRIVYRANSPLSYTPMLQVRPRWLVSIAIADFDGDVLAEGQSFGRPDAP
jgi:hypothetical protein